MRIKTGRRRPLDTRSQNEQEKQRDNVRRFQTSQPAEIVLAQIHRSGPLKVMRSKGKPQDKTTDHEEKLDAAEPYYSRLGKPVGMWGSSTIERRLRRQVSVQVKQDDHADGCEAQAVHLRDKLARTRFTGNMSQESAGDRIAPGNRRRGRAFLQDSDLQPRSNILRY